MTGASLLALAAASLSLFARTFLRFRKSTAPTANNAKRARNPITMPAIAPPERLLWCTTLGGPCQLSPVGLLDDPLEVTLEVALELVLAVAVWVGLTFALLIGAGTEEMAKYSVML